MIDRQHIHDDLTASGLITVQLHNHVTGETTLQTTHNLVTDSGLNLLSDLLTGRATGITHLAVGTGSTTPTASDTALEAEVYRVAVTRGGRGATGVAEFETFLSRAAANVVSPAQLREIGLFAGTTLYARALFTAGIPKTKDFSMIASWSSRIKPEVS